MPRKRQTEVCILIYFFLDIKAIPKRTITTASIEIPAISAV